MEGCEMPLSLKEAFELAINGQSEEYVARFIEAVKFAAITGNSAAVSLDDALVASIVLARLMDTVEGRRLLKMPKRKNLQYRASDFHFTSPQRKVAADFIAKKIDQKSALEKLCETFADPPDDRTLKRLFDDLVETQIEFDQRLREMLIAAGADADRLAAADEIMKNLGYPTKPAK
jgi:hypothetical protein